MVRTDADLGNLPPAKRLEVLKELQAKKKEELKKFQEEKEQEIKSAQAQLEATIEELAEEDEHLEDEQEQQHQTLEEAITGKTTAPKSGGPVYENPLDRLVPSSLADLANNDLYNEVKRIEEKGYMTPEEQQRIAEINAQAQAITDAYSRQDINRVNHNNHNYLRRTESVLKRLDEKIHNLNQQGLYDTHVYKGA